jgi:ubiquinol-cytochrome c reductase cytochrome c1 subunit
MRGLGFGFFIFLGISAALVTAKASVGVMADVDITQPPEELRHGAETIINVCLGCHSLKYLKYGDLSQLGFTEKEVDTLRNGKSLKEPLQTDMAPEMLRESFGVVPPDLSLMAKAREGGPRYIYTLLTGFYQKADGAVDNHLFPSVRMPDVLNYSDAKDAPQRVAVQTQARDAAVFLAWVADPHDADRHRLGYYVLGYLALFTLLLYLSKRRIWARLR